MEKIEYTLTDIHGPNLKCCGTLPDLILDAGIIPHCGLIPPFRVLAAVLRTGGGDGGMSHGCIWDAFALREEDYWRAVDMLERFTPDELGGRDRVRQFSDELRPDYSAPDTDNYGLWLESLVTRGYLPGSAFGKVRR